MALGASCIRLSEYSKLFKNIAPPLLWIKKLDIHERERGGEYMLETLHFKCNLHLHYELPPFFLSKESKNPKLHYCRARLVWGLVATNQNPHAQAWEDFATSSLPFCPLGPVLGPKIETNSNCFISIFLNGYISSMHAITEMLMSRAAPYKFPNPSS